MQEWKMKAYLHAIYDSILKNSGLNPKGIAREVFFAPIRDPFFRFHDGSRFTGVGDSYERLGDLLGYSKEDMLVGTLSILSARFSAVVKSSVFKTCAPASRIYAVEEFLLSNSPELDKLVYAFSGISMTEMKKRVDTFFTCSPDDPGLNQADGYTLNLRFHQDNKSSYTLSCLAIASTPAVLSTILDEAMLKAGSFYDARNPGKDYPVSATIEKNGILILKTRVVPAIVAASGSDEPKVWDFAKPLIDWECCEWLCPDVALLRMVISLASKEAGQRYKNQCLTDALGL
jgi:hypothetical protein